MSVSELGGWPKKILSGPGAIDRLGDEIKKLGGRRVIVFSGPHISKTAVVLEPMEKMRAAGIDAVASPSLAAAIRSAASDPRALICGSLFLAGEALVELGAYPWPSCRFDVAELLTPTC